ncbi:MAG: response regulator transcription factor [Bacteroidota bacterium]
MSYTTLVVGGRSCLLRDGLVDLLTVSSSAKVYLAEDWAALSANGKKAKGRMLALLVFPDLQSSDVGFAQQFFQRFPKIDKLIVQMGGTANHARQWIKAGANGLLSGETNRQEVDCAIEAIGQGKRFLGERIKHMLSMAALDVNQLVKVKLTKRESEVLSLIVREYTTQEIATRLFISKNTAETHRLNIIRKLGVRNTAGVVREALLSGLYVA